MRAFILAAGHGERLRPLTSEQPKALMPVANTPVVVRVLQMLQSCDVKEACINTHAYTEEVRAVIGDGNDWDIDLQYSIEPELLGTGGGIGNVAAFLENDRILLVNADVVCDVDISAVLDFHISKKARATLLMTEAPDILDDDIISVTHDGQIRDKAQLVPVRTGLYTGIAILEPSVLELIPRGYSTLMDSVLRPLAREGTLYGYFYDGYWSDINTIERYFRANFSIISGRAHLPIQARQISDTVWMHESAEIDFTTEIEEPVLIGKDVSIDRGSKIGPNVVIGDGSIIGVQTKITNSILWKNVTVKGAAYIDTAVIADDQKIGYAQKCRRIIMQARVAEPMFNVDI